MDKGINDNIKVSVIVPVYNTGRFIEDCIKSIQKQSLQEIEIIFVDDGSVDNSCEIIEGYAEKDYRITLLRQNHQGAGAARNLGLENAVGEYISFLDSDDFWYDTNALEYMYTNGKKENAAICASYRMNFTADGYKEINYLNLKDHPSEPRWVDFVEVQNDWFFQSYIYLRSALVRYGIKFPPYLRGQDPPFLLSMMKLEKKFLLCPIRLHCYRWGHQIKRTYSEIQVVDILKGQHDILQMSLECNWQILVETVIKRLNANYYNMIKKYLSNAVLEQLKLIDKTLYAAGYHNKLDILNEVKLSIIVPVYNVELYLKECLESLVSQDVKDIEIICVDDGSTDGSNKILEEYEEKYHSVRVFHKENGGLSSARNFGLNKARGKYVVFVDSDDLWKTKDAASYIINLMEKEGLDMLIYGIEPFFESEELENVYGGSKGYYSCKKSYGQYEHGFELMQRMYVGGDYVPSACIKAIKREILDSTGIKFYDGIVHEDELFNFLLMMSICRCRHESRIIYRRRYRQDSIMTSKISFANLIGIYTVWIESIKWMELHEIPKEAEKIVKAMLLRFEKHIMLKYRKLDQQERRKIDSCNFSGRYLLQQILDKIKMSSINKELQDNCIKMKMYLKDEKISKFIYGVKYAALARKYRAEMIVDDNNHLWGEMLMQVPVCSPEILSEFEDRAIVYSPKQRLDELEKRYNNGKLIFLPLED